MTKKLTASQEAFARGVASGLSQAEAYRRAYPRSKGWKPEAVHRAGAKMAALANVSARVKELQGQAAVVAVLDKAKVLREVAMLAHSDIAGIIGEGGRVLLPNELDPATRAAVKSFKIDEYGKIEYQFWDKRASLDMTMKHLGLYELDNKQKTDPLADLLGTLKGNVIGPA
ncbi:terminase small subunit [Roseateles sp. So40a]|uniref:terminase small subunit n=1 Tax=Roseateles sp. So40a TaxID=3400226 RepID=UPI003A8BA0EA